MQTIVLSILDIMEWLDYHATKDAPNTKDLIRLFII